MTTRGIEHFPYPEDWADDLLGEPGYRQRAVSVFDHWLTEKEWEESPYITLERARTVGLEENFFEQCYQFQEFYRCLFEKGVFRLTGLRTKRQVTWHPHWDRRLKKAVNYIAWDLRWGSEFYAPAEHLRVISGDDRTDLLLLEEEADEQALENLANKFGLHFLRKQNWR